MFSALAAELEQSEFSWGGWESVEVEILGDVALVYAWGPATLVTANRNTRFCYRLTGVLVRSDGRWLWRMHHGSEPGAW